MATIDKASIDFTFNNTSEPISKAFKTIGVDNFYKASTWVNKLPYGRNSNKTNVFSLFDE